MLGARLWAVVKFFEKVIVVDETTHLLLERRISVEVLPSV